MSWEDVLTRDERQQLHRWHPMLSLEEIAIQAVEHRAYAAAFARMGARVVTYDEYMDEWHEWHRNSPGYRRLSVPSEEDYPQVDVPFESEKQFVALLLVAAKPPEDQDESGGLQRRDPLSVHETTSVVRQRVVERKSFPKIEDTVSLSHRKIDYIRKALKHGDLGWDWDQDGLTFGPETENTPAGIVLPSR